tara:strand:+ start:186 stop:737 length:552 start_codon:yes stop_codon:yes gene_type:complete
MFFRYKYIPNYLSLLRIFLTPIFTIAMFQNTFFYKLISLKIFFFASLSDFLDGYIARKYNFVSNFGKNIDPISDKILVITSFIVLSIFYPSIVTFWMVCLIVLRDILVILLRYYRLKTLSPLQTSFIAKRKTLIQIIIIHLILILHIIEPSYIVDNQYLYYMVLLSIGLSWFSAFAYILPAKK